MGAKIESKTPDKSESKSRREVFTWSPSSWGAWKICPMKFKIRADKWSNPQTKPERRTAVLAVPGLVIDRLFELWIHRAEFDNREWLESNFRMVWNMVCARRKPKWTTPSEAESLLLQTQNSIRILYELLHRHDLLLPGSTKAQTDFHELITDRIAIAGAMDLWTIRKDGTVVLVDFKNFGSARKRSTDQLHMYAMALERILGCGPDEAGYVCFHPEFPGYRKRELRLCDRKKLLARLERATDLRAKGEFPAKYSYYACPRFCEVRFGCEEFCLRCGMRGR